MNQEKPNLCPCCGAEMAGTPKVEYLRQMPLSTVEYAIADLLIRRHPRIVPLEAIIGHVYSGTANGGPASAKQVILTIIHRLRKKLRKSGWTIKANAGGRGNFGQYQLEPLDQAT